MNLTEKQIEDVFEIFHAELIENDLTLIERQHIFDNRLRADLIFQDKNGIKVIIELKRTAVTRENIGQLLEYHGLFDTPKVRVILASPYIPETIRKSFEHFGIEYIQFSLTEIEKLYDQIKNKPKTEIKKEKIELPKSILTRPLSEKIIDGNVAFKITFNDNNWMNPCSPDVAKYNFKHRTWCSIQSHYEDNCQHPIWNERIEEFALNAPCVDCVSLRTLSFYPGHFHGEKHNNEPKRCLGAKMGKISLFTSKEPGANEMDRFIFAIGQIEEIITLEEAESERIFCNPEKMVFIPDNLVKYWKFVRNENTDRIAWNTGLFRYVDDKTIRLILEDIILNTQLKEEEISNAKYLLTQI